jgi:hypothetical protein
VSHVNRILFLAAWCLYALLLVHVLVKTVSVYNDCQLVCGIACWGQTGSWPCCQSFSVSAPRCSRASNPVVTQPAFVCLQLHVLWLPVSS